MFSYKRTSKLSHRALGALRLTRSFLLLEDDYDVDWEVDRNERAQAEHPHRMPLRSRSAHRRPGQPPLTPQRCVSPVPRATNPRTPSRPRAAGAPRLPRGVGLVDALPACSIAAS
jgi:hypothetical protein